MQEGPRQAPPHTCSAPEARPPHTDLTRLTPVLARALRERFCLARVGVENLEGNMNGVATRYTRRCQPGARGLLWILWICSETKGALEHSQANSSLCLVLCRMSDQRYDFIVSFFLFKYQSPSGWRQSHFLSALEGPFPSTLPHPTMRVLV